MPEATYADHAANLNSARKGSLKNSAKKAKKAITGTVNFFSLLGYINPFIDWLFGIALILAILKDILDIVNNALIAAGGVGEILIIIFTFFISVFIFLVMIITGSVGKTKMARNTIKKILAIIGIAIAEAIPAIDLLPMETILVVTTFWMTLRERKKGAQENDQARQ
jgi:hypothetical protein